MNFVDFQKHVGTLATKYSDFEFNIRIYDLEGLSSDKYVDYDGKEIEQTEFPEKREGSVMIEAGFGPTSLLDDIITEIKSKAADLGLQQYDNLQYDAGPYVWTTIIFSVKDAKKNKKDKRAKKALEKDEEEEKPSVCKPIKERSHV